MRDETRYTFEDGMWRMPVVLRRDIRALMDAPYHMFRVCLNPFISLADLTYQDCPPATAVYKTLDFTWRSPLGLRLLEIPDAVNAFTHRELQRELREERDRRQFYVDEIVGAKKALRGADFADKLRIADYVKYLQIRIQSEEI
jgi:hypothetical protein